MIKRRIGCKGSRNAAFTRGSEFYGEGSEPLGICKHSVNVSLIAFYAHDSELWKNNVIAIRDLLPPPTEKSFTG